MKKILALLVAVVMVFSIAAIPASAVLSESAQAITDSFNEGDLFAAIENTFTFIREFIDELHALVGNIMAILDKECAFCNELHVLAA
ncbi:MAG: hypothetical protein J6Q79_03185 [Clostridia bacterium]|nr:hypothetical protein [Clostridia bacterium]